MLECAGVCRSVQECVGVCWGVLDSVAAWCSVLRCGALCQIMCVLLELTCAIFCVRWYVCGRSSSFCPKRCVKLIQGSGGFSYTYV